MARLKKTPLAAAITQHLKQSTHHRMIYLAMYDIENNKIRRELAKYLLRKGGIRIQKSVLVLSMQRPRYEEVAQTLRQMQELYDNNDTILLVPIEQDNLAAMHMIGRQLYLHWITKPGSTYFF